MSSPTMHSAQCTMSKRPRDDSSPAHPHDASNGLLPINDLLSPGDDRDDHAAGTVKRPRNFIASIVYLHTCTPKYISRV